MVALRTRKDFALAVSQSPAPSSEQYPAGIGAPRRARIAPAWLRRDNWRRAPLLTVIGLLAWMAYVTVRIMTQEHYWVEDFHYLTPFFSPCVTESCHANAALFGRFLPEFPPLIPFAIFTLPLLFLFRFTCYYYRKAYWRSFANRPRGCAIPDKSTPYKGESKWPMIINNSHRYFFYVAVIISCINTYDAILAFHSPGGFGIGLGTIIIWLNVILLWAYTLSCHSCRHILLGRINHFSRHPARYQFWQVVSKLNTHHMQLAWTTLGTLMLTDAYIALVSAGTITDLRILN